MVPHSLLLALIIRSCSLLLPHTFFQPDEFYQAFEPAHKLVFGYGYLTWEWRDLPSTGFDWWSRHVAGGRMRSWLWPSTFAFVYKALQAVRLDQTFLLTLAPRFVGVLIAAGTDYATCRLASKLLGPGAAAGALFLSLTSLFNAHLLPRALSTSPETLLVALALVYFPLPHLKAPTLIAVGHPPLVTRGDLADSEVERKLDNASRDAKNGFLVVFPDVPDIDYVVMDRMAPHVRPFDRPLSSLVLSVFCASLAICIRPTTLPLWAFLSADLALRTYRKDGSMAAISTAVTGLATLVLTLGASTLVDFVVTGRFLIPTLTFVHQNVFRNIAAFYGATDPLYHLVQSIPIMLFPIWWWWAQGIVSCLVPTALLPRRLSTLDRPEGMRTLSRALAFTIATLSFSPHSEWRFLHPLLPGLLLFALPPLYRGFTPTIFGCYRLAASLRQYVRFAKFPFYLCLLAPLLPWLYLNTAHGRAQVEVINVLRRGELGNVTGVVALMPCHSTPWMSHLHTNVEGWFLTCEPPLEANPFEHVTQQAMFYQRPVTYLESVFPYPPGPLHQSTTLRGMNQEPSHVLLFGELLQRTEKTEKGQTVSVESALRQLGYHEVWQGWNGFDILQDEAERRGGVRVWSR